MNEVHDLFASPKKPFADPTNQDEEEDVGRCYACERGQGRQAPMLDLRRLDGSHFTFSYTAIGPLEFHGTDITLSATMPNGDVYNITITGRNLSPLYDAIRRNRCASIQQSDDLRDTTPDSATVITGLHIEKQSED